jgi:hypothetical protein
MPDPVEFTPCVAEERNGETMYFDGKKRTGTVHHRKFSSFVDYIDFIDQPGTSVSGGPSGGSSVGSGDFNEHYDLDEAKRVAREGWHDGRERVLEIIDDLDVGDIDMRGEKISHTHNAFGQRLDMGRYQTGDPECWVSRTTVESENSIGTESVSIYCNISASGSIPRSAFFHRGAAVAGLAEILEWHGIATEIKAVETCGKKSRPAAVVHEITVKRPSEPLNADVLAFQLADPDMLRRINFAACERETEEAQKIIGRNYGEPADYGRHKESDSIYIPALHGLFTDWSDQEKAERWITNMLEDRGIIEANPA